MYHHPWIYGRNPETSPLLDDIAKAINGEYSAIACYTRLAEAAPNESVKNQIMEIREDEIRHYRQISYLYSRLTGRQHTPQITEECPSDFRAGLDFAFRDEQETVDFYQGIADRTNDPAIREVFRRAAADEQNHAVWFLYYLNAGR